MLKDSDDIQVEEWCKEGGEMGTEADGRKREGQEKKEVQRLWRQESRNGYYYRCHQIYNEEEVSIEGEN